MTENRININGKVIFNTGNIMSINDITKKPSQNSTQELIDAIKYTIKEYSKSGDSMQHADHSKIISRPDDNVQLKIQEFNVEELKIGIKIFLTKNDDNNELNEAFEFALQQQLNVKNVADVIISLKNPKQQQETTSSGNNLEKIKTIWRKLEEYVEKKTVNELGIADIEESTFRELFTWAKIKPTIIQINLATCCVVPPTLQQFCKENDIKLFTHSDSSDILPEISIEEIFGKPLLELLWAVRFTVHIKCRGVLTTKGYCLCITPKEH